MFFVCYIFLFAGRFTTILPSAKQEILADKTTLI